jgi:hypothetical protein
MSERQDELLQVVYLSTAHRPLGFEELQQIVEVSRRNNLASGLTGMLLYHDGTFVQALEGPADQVRKTLDRIEGDATHHSILVLIQDNVTKREFGAWSMGFARPGTESASEWVDADPRTITPGRAKTLLLSFVQNAR